MTWSDQVNAGPIWVVPVLRMPLDLIDRWLLTPVKAGSSGGGCVVIVDVSGRFGWCLVVAQCLVRLGW